MYVFNGIETIMIATPTNADHPRMLYNDTNARVISSRNRQHILMHAMLRARLTWNGPEMAMRPYVHKS